MKINQSSPGRWWTVALFAVAMAWVEAAVVFYLRTMIDRIEPYQANPLPIFGGLGQAELVREAATLVMLFTVGMLAGQTWRARFAYMAIAFGIWDIFYYVFLKVLTGWPHTLLDWDILFLLPLPWWGPVLAPVLISVLMILWGTLTTQFERIALAPAPNWKPWALNLMGIALALYTFMVDAIRVAGEGEAALRNMLPRQFNWPLFCLALGLMSMPVLRLLCELWNAQYRESSAPAIAELPPQSG
jgi:hypothetical protein